MRVLVVDRAPPLDLRQGNSLIGRHIFRRLAQQHELTLLAPAPANELPQMREVLASEFSEVYLVPRAQRLPALGGYVSADVATRLPYAVQSPSMRWSAMFSATLDHVFLDRQFDVIHTRELPMAGFTRSVSHNAKLLELVDSSALRERRRRDDRSPLGWMRYPIARTLERHAVSKFGVVTTVSPTDSDLVHQLSPDCDVRTIVNGVDTEYFAPLAVTAEPDTIAFVGAMSFAPNIDAVIDFHHTVWPFIRAARPAARFVICGRDPAPRVAALAGDSSVTVTGAVSDVRPWLARATLVICPMRHGSGVKNKVLEALAMAKPVVSSPLGVEALGVADGTELVIASTPHAFAERCLQLLDDAGMRSALGVAGREYVQRHHSWDSCAAAYNAIYQELQDPSATRNADSSSHELRHRELSVLS